MDELNFIGDSKIQIKEIPMPVPNDDEVLLKMKASGICCLLYTSDAADE